MRIKEIVAAALLIALFSLSLFNVRYLDNMVADLMELVDISESHAKSGDFEGAKTTLKTASERWTGADGYTHIVLRHSEIDAATDAFYELLGDIGEEDYGIAAGSYEKLKARLESLSGMEHLTLRSVF